MADERIHYLVTRYFDHACTPEEKEELAGWINQATGDDELKAVLEQAWHEYEPDVALMEMADPALSRIAMRLFGEKATQNTEVIRPILLRIRWWAAAAIFAGIVIGGVYLWNRHAGTEGAPVASQAPSPDVPPGGNKAILTLSNGTRIVLDSAHNGQLASQGNTNVVKVNSGLLAYHAPSNLSQSFRTIQYNMLTTPRGGQYQLMLPDGSKVWLNAASSITYPAAFEGKEREVKITGEVYFEVVHNDQMPFRVKAGNEIIEDLGTHFNINAYPDEPVMKITLLEGSIRTITGAHADLLSPGEQLQINPTGQIKIIRDADTEQVVAWKNGLFQFDHSDIKEVMRQIARWYNVDVIYEGQIPKKRFSGNIYRRVNLQQALKILAYFNVHFRIQGKTVIITA